MCRFNRLCVFLTALLSPAASICEEMALLNADFEMPSLSEGDRSDNEIPGWQAIDVDGPFQFGALNPAAGEFPTGAPQGVGVGYLRRGSIYQILPEPLIAGAQYEISFYAGDSLLEPFGPAVVQLRIGRTRVNLTGTPPSGQFFHFRSNLVLPPTVQGPVELWIQRLDDDVTRVFYVDDISIRTVPTSRCPYDITGNLEVNLSDLSVLLSHFGEPAGQTQASGDVDGDEDVDLVDLGLLLAHFGETCG